MEQNFNIFGLTIPDHVLFTTILTISIFVLGFIFRAWINKITENIKLSRKESLMLHFLSYFDNRADYQVKALQFYAKEIELSLHRNFIKIPTFEFEYFKEAKEDIFGIIFYRKFGSNIKKNKLYQGILGNIKVFQDTLLDVFRKGDECNLEIESSETKSNEILTEIFKFIDSLKLKSSKSKIDVEIVTDKEDGISNKDIDAQRIFISADYLPQGSDIGKTTQGHQDLMDQTVYIIGKRLIEYSDCKSCHQIDQKSIGPTYKDVAGKYANQAPAIIQTLTDRIINGGGGVWGDVDMAAHPQLSQQEVEQMVKYILTLGTSNVQNGLPIKGTIALDQHKPGEKEGSYILSASYSDNGANGIASLTGRSILVLRYPVIMAKDFDEGVNTMLYEVKAEDTPGFNDDVTVLVGMHKSKVHYYDIDFTGVSSIDVAAVVVTQLTAGGILHFRLDNAEAPVFGTIKVEVSITNLGVRTFSLPINSVEGIHTLIMEVESANPKNPLGAIISLELINK